MSETVNAGRLRERVQLLACRETSEHTWQWMPLRQTWASIEQGTERNLFSSVGIGARSAQLILRRQELTGHHAILWGAQHLFLTAIVPLGRQYLQVSAALVEVVSCKGETYATKVDPEKNNRPRRVQGPVVCFPAVLTEKYVGYQRESSHAAASTTYVLVTPKEVRLTEGDLVTIQEGQAPGVYDVQGCHWLDPYKNEYEMTWKRDV